MILLLFSTVARAAVDCPRQFDTTEVLDAASLAEGSFTAMQAAPFAAARHTMEKRLECLNEVISPSAVARIERVEALGAFLDQRDAQVPQALAGLFAAEPGHQIPIALLPDGHPIRALITPAMLLLREDPGVTLPVPPSGWLEVDGTHALVAPIQRIAVLQQIDGQGAVVATHLRWPDEPGFDWVVPVAASTAPAVAEKGHTHGAPTSWGHRAPLLGVTLASLVTSGALYAVAAHGYGEFDAEKVMGPDATDSERAAYRTQLEGMQARTNPVAYGCFAAAGLGLAFGVVTVVAW